jgi:hypothetical protein
VAAVVVAGNIIFARWRGTRSRAIASAAARDDLLVLSTIMLPKQVILVPLYIHAADGAHRHTGAHPCFSSTVQHLPHSPVPASIPTDCEEGPASTGGEMSIPFRVGFDARRCWRWSRSDTAHNWNCSVSFYMTNSTSMRTLPVGLALLSQGARIDRGHLMAGAVISALPVVARFSCSSAVSWWPHGRNDR